MAATDPSPATLVDPNGRDLNRSLDPSTRYRRADGKKLSIEDVLANDQLHDDLATIGFKRFQASALYMFPYRDKWLRYYKMYRNLVDTVEDEDEPNTAIVYAYSLVEDLVSKISEPILQMQTPCRVAARRAGQEPMAERFSNMFASYIRTGEYQREYTNSTREMIITGNAWENDCWNAEYQQSRVWQKTMKSKLLSGIKDITGMEIPGVSAWYNDIEEKTVQTAFKVGYSTRFPSVWRIYPEPHVNDIKQMHWLVEEQPSVAITDLEKMTYFDKSGQRKPFFNFDKLKASYMGKGGEIKPEPMSRQYSSQEDEFRVITGDQPEKDRSLNYADDIDRISLQWHWEPHRVFCIAQGRFIVAYIEDLFQDPRIPYRLKRYTPQKDFLFGTGALEPIENQLNELSDIHKMSMRNWVRIINRMVAYEEDSVPYASDWTPRAMGRIRVRPPTGKSVAESIVPINHQDVTPSMLAQESNVKGLIERAISVVDYSPGTDGTKQTHKTLGGLMEISRNVAQRITTIQRMQLSCYQEQMWAAEKLTSQFLLDPLPFTVYGPDGSTTIMEFDLWDVATGGVGFDYIIEYDPSFGDDQLRRNQLMALLGQAFQYIMQVKQLRLDAALPNVEDLFRRILKSFGWSDTSQIMVRPGGPTPDEEFNQMLAGQPVQPNPHEDLIDHLASHMAEKMVLPAVASQRKMPPELLQRTMMLLDAHIAATQQMIVGLLKNPQPLVTAKVQEKMAELAPSGSQPGGQMSPMGAGGGGGAPSGQIVPPTGQTGTPPSAGMGI